MKSIAEKREYKTARILIRSHETALDLRKIITDTGKDVSLVEVIDIAIINELERRQDEQKGFVLLSSAQLKDAWDEDNRRVRAAQAEEQRREAAAHYVE